MIRETVVIRGVEYRLSAQTSGKHVYGFEHPQMGARLVSMVRVQDNKVIWGKI